MTPSILVASAHLRLSHCVSCSQDYEELLAVVKPTTNSELAITADLEPIERAIWKLRERYPAMYLAAALASLPEQLDPAEAASATSMTALRQADFAGGRLAARRALYNAGSADSVVVADEHGVPLFPGGYAGSIAHKHGRAVAIVVSTADVRSVGIDLEFDENHDEESLVAEIVTEAEQPQLAILRASEPTLLSPATLVLAAKEAVYKAVFQVTQTRFDFEDAELLFGADARAFRAVRFPGHEQLRAEGGYELAGRWIVALALVGR